jgi:hypothetical protein
MLHHQGDDLGRRLLGRGTRDERGNAGSDRARGRGAAEVRRVIARIEATRAANVGRERADRRDEIDRIAIIREKRLVVELVDGADRHDAPHGIELIRAELSIVVARGEDHHGTLAPAAVVEDVVNGVAQERGDRRGLGIPPAIRDDRGPGLEGEIEGLDRRRERHERVVEHTHASLAASRASARDADAVVRGSPDEPRASRAMLGALVGRVVARILVAIDDVEPRIELLHEIRVSDVATGIDHDDARRWIALRDPPRLGHPHSLVVKVPLPGKLRVVRDKRRATRLEAGVEVGKRASDAGRAEVVIARETRGDVEPIPAGRVLDEVEADRGHERLFNGEPRARERRSSAGIEPHDRRLVHGSLEDALADDEAYGREARPRGVPREPLRSDRAIPVEKRDAGERRSQRRFRRGRKREQRKNERRARDEPGRHRASRGRRTERGYASSARGARTLTDARGCTFVRRCDR